MDKNETKEHVVLLNVKLMRSIDTLVTVYNKGMEFFKEKKPDGDDVDSYYAAVLTSFTEGVLTDLLRGGGAAVATCEPIIVAAATIKYLAEHPEFKSNLMF